MFIGILLIIGLSIGSFINALVWRLHEHKNWVRGRSECVNCHHPLIAVDLVPVFSWLILKGRCRYCHKKISSQYPIVEILTAGLFIVSYLFWPVKIGSFGVWAMFIFWLLILIGLLALAVYDLRWMILPNGLVIYLLIVAVIFIGINVLSQPYTWTVFLNLGLGVLIGGGLFYVLFQISNGRWIGGGDVKLGFVLGLLAASAQRSFLMIFLAALTGCLVSIPFVTFGKLHKKSIIPFGPFLIAGIIIVQLTGTAILGWYGRTFLGV